MKRYFRSGAGVTKGKADGFLFRLPFRLGSLSSASSYGGSRSLVCLRWDTTCGSCDITSCVRREEAAKCDAAASNAVSDEEYMADGEGERGEEREERGEREEREGDFGMGCFP